MTKKFQYTGLATIQHINARKEGPDDEKELAVDLKLTADVGEDNCDEILDMLGECLRDFLFLEGGAVRNIMMGPLTFRYEIEDYVLEALGSQHYGAKVKKIQIEPRDTYCLTLTFAVSFKPTGDEVARMAEYLQEGMEIILRPSSEELDLGGGGGGDHSPDAGKMVSNASDDELLAQARQIVVTSQRASISRVQRDLKIGYNRAASLLEQLEEQGVVSSIDSQGLRNVLVTA